jgi:hypothetical protein
MTSRHELAFELTPLVTTDDGHLYEATVVAQAAPDGHWNAWLEFVAPGSDEVLATGVETHQSSEANLAGWARTLSDVYLRGALERARLSRSETYAHHLLGDIASAISGRGAARAFDPFELFKLGEHVLRRELQLFGPSTLRALIITHDLNPRGLDVSRFTKPQLVAFIVTAIGVQQTDGRRRRGPHRRSRAS